MLWFKNKYNNISEELLKSVEENEGFSSKAYIDVLVANAPLHYGIPPDELAIIEKHLDKLKLTFGMGLTFITKKEAKKVTEMRLKAIKKQVIANYPYIKNNDVLDVLTEMAYQMGIRGLFGFEKMHIAIKNKEYSKARLEGLDSKWHNQTPRRAEILMGRLANC